MLIVGDTLEGPYHAPMVADCPFCAAIMERYHSDESGVAYHPLDKGCILDGFGVLPERVALWNRRDLRNDG